MAATIGKPDYQRVLDALYSSAEEVLRMWERVEEASRRF
jgi:hypothetical protein